MTRRIALLLATALVVLTACGDDDASDDSALTNEEREWCSLDEASDETAFRFDQIFEAGLALGLPMDALNAQASALRTEYAEEGLDDDEQVKAVSEALLEEPVYIQACRQAYADNVG